MNESLVFTQHTLLCELGEKDGHPTFAACMLVNGMHPVLVFDGDLRGNDAQQHLVHQIVECGDYQLGLCKPERYAILNPDSFSERVVPSVVFGMRTPLGFIAFGRICGNVEEDLGQFYQKVTDGFRAGNAPSDLGEVIDIKTQQ